MFNLPFTIVTDDSWHILVVQADTWQQATDTADRYLTAAGIHYTSIRPRDTRIDLLASLGNYFRQVAPGIHTNQRTR